jgi:hypothetical protein
MPKSAKDRSEDWEAKAKLQRMCDESQADGVPCEELERDCEECEQAHDFPKDQRDRPPAEDDEQPVSGA